MRSLDRVVIALGALDIFHVCWAVIPLLEPDTSSKVTAALGSGLFMATAVLATIIVAYAGAYCLILASGIQLLRRKRSAAWLNYLLLPIRVVLRLPTLLPVFLIFPTLPLELGFVSYAVLLVGTELLRIVIIYRWHRSYSRPRNNSFKPNPLRSTNNMAD